MSREPFSPDDELALRHRMKAELRRRLRAVRVNLGEAAWAERSRALVERLAAHDAVARAASVALFFPIVERREVDLRALDAQLRARGARVAYPAIDPDTGAMTFRFVDALSELEERGFGFAEPAATAPEADALDVVVVPALAVDPSGQRLGYGRGYYDRTLPRFAPPAVTVAVAFDWQVMVELPVTSGDVAVDAVLTDARTLR